MTHAEPVELGGFDQAHTLLASREKKAT